MKMVQQCAAGKWSVNYLEKADRGWVKKHSVEMLPMQDLVRALCFTFICECRFNRNLLACWIPQEKKTQATTKDSGSPLLESDCGQEIHNSCRGEKREFFLLFFLCMQSSRPRTSPQMCGWLCHHNEVSKPTMVLSESWWREWGGAAEEGGMMFCCWGMMFCCWPTAGC